MKNIHIEYTEKFTPSPLSFWVHKHPAGEIWMNADDFDPPLPSSVSGKGYVRVIITFDDIDLEFASVDELQHFKDVLSKKNMPTSLQLSKKRGTAKGPNSHWLSRLPARMLSWNKRKKLIPLIDKAIAAVKKA